MGFENENSLSLVGFLAIADNNLNMGKSWEFSLKNGRQARNFSGLPTVWM